ncbi:hypothetical protein AYO39_00180 [Actinobacteria bacterium SCGC AG-212-D09]|nr:hypothetical protein AYO39_00180 [Actinobacteria bacterium SCGC AG-212-D09]
MPVDDPASVFRDDPQALWRLRRELSSVPELRWAGFTCPHKHSPLQVLVAMDPHWHTSGYGDWVNTLSERLGTAAGRQVDVEPIAYNSLPSWAHRHDVHSLLTSDEFEYAPGTLPPVESEELGAMRARYKQDLERMRSESAKALALLRE